MTVGISMPTLESKNTQDVSAELVRELNNMGHEADIQSAEGNIQTQISQLQNMIETCDVLIVWAVDGSEIEDVMQQAKEHGLTVISFDERICSEAVSYYTGFDYFQAGRLQGQYIVDRYEASGTTEPQNIVVFTSDSRLCLEVFYGAMEVLQPYIDDGRFL